MSDGEMEPGRLPLEPRALDARLHHIAQTPFRSRLTLRKSELAYTASHEPATIARHARKIIDERLAPARPTKDGSQTPWGGHPVFRAQHATGTCCRKCLQTNHGISRGHELTESERLYVVAIVCRWIELESRAMRARAPSPPPTLF